MIAREAIEQMAIEAGIGAVKHVEYRRGRRQPMTQPELDSWASVEALCALVYAAAVEDAARACDAQQVQQDIDNGIADTGGAAACAAAIRALAAQVSSK